MRIKFLILILIAFFVILSLFFVLKKPEKNWENVKGYKKALENCEMLCNDYIFSDCSKINAELFCFFSSEIDLDENGKIEEKKGISPLGIEACENTVFCPFILDCKCKGRVLNLQECAKIKCEVLYDAGISKEEANEIVNKFLWGSCSATQEKFCQ
jgi:hypothetical protein